MADVDTIVAELQASVPEAIHNLMPAGHVVARREQEADPERSRRIEMYGLDVPRSRLAGDFIVTKEPIIQLPDLDTIIGATHKEDGIEALAWYKSYHYWLSQRWGIKILEEGVFYTARCLQDGHPSQELSKFDSLDYVQLAFNILQLHEYFHFMADVACTILELAQRKPLFCQYSSTVYPQDKFEEAIANAYASRMMRKAGISEAVKQFMTKQPLPYGQFFQWTTRRAFQYGRQKLMELMCHDLPSSTGSAAGAELLLRIDHADLDYQDAPIYLESSRVARRVSSPLLFVESIRNLESSAKFDSENAQLPHETNKKVANTVDNLSCNLQQPSLHFKKIRGHGAVFMCKVDNIYSISLCHHGEDRWELLRVGRHGDIYSNPW